MFDIVLMVGIPGSGKTTFCRERLFPSHLYISLDQLRTRSAEAELFAFALKRRKPCVIDNTNVTAAERRRYIPLARRDKDVRIVVYCFAPDFGEGIDEIYDVKVSENGFDVRRRNEEE